MLPGQPISSPLSKQFPFPFFNTILIFLGVLLWAEYGAASDFSQDSAYAFLRVLAQDIGPRPMGSPAEKDALEYAAGRFSEFGCQESYVMPIRVAGTINTSSGNAVGIVRGKSGRMIVIGGHIDSAGPEIPGANDDGSGAATVIELARVLGRSHPNSTLVFCCWGGEEQGLIGSKYFVEHFSEIDSVDLMLQIDMANGGRFLGPDPNAPGFGSAPRWLVQAAYDEFYDSLGYQDLKYESNIMVINKAAGGIFGSDHVPFLERGIPAIDFSSDVSDPIHTPQDNLENFNPSGLKRSGDLVLSLVKRFDKGVPSREIEEYMLLQFSQNLFFLNPILLRIFAFIGLVVGIVTYLNVRSQKLPMTEVVRWSGAKLLFFSFLLQGIIWSSPALVSAISGVRHPWVNNQTGFYVLAFFAGLTGFWVVSRLENRYKVSLEVHSLFLRSLMIFSFMIIGFSILSPDLAAYPATALILVSLSLLLRPTWLKALCLLLSPYFIWRLIFNEGLVLIQRGIALAPDRGFLFGLLIDAVYVVVFGLLTLPFAFAFVAVYRGSVVDLFWMRRFQKPIWLVLSLIGVAALTGFLAAQPVYDKEWHKFVRVTQEWELGSDSSRIKVESAEPLNSAGLSINGKDTTFRGGVTSVTIDDESPPRKWFRVHSVDSLLATGNGIGGEDLSRVLRFDLPQRPYTLSVRYDCDSSFSLFSPWESKSEGRSVSLKWYSFPDSNLVLPMTFTSASRQQIIQEIEITYNFILSHIYSTSPFTTTTHRMKIRSRDTLDFKRTGFGL